MKRSAWKKIQIANKRKNDQEPSSTPRIDLSLRGGRCQSSQKKKTNFALSSSLKINYLRKHFLKVQIQFSSFSGNQHFCIKLLKQIKDCKKKDQESL